MSTTFDSLVSDILQTLQGYGQAQPRAAFLTTAIDTDDLQVGVGDVTDFEQGVAEIGNETVFIESVDRTNNILTLAPDGRGYYGTTAASHSVSDRITMAPTWPKGRVASAINEAILNTYPTLFGITTTTFSFNPSITTYDLPAGAKRVLHVRCDTIGPSNEQLRIPRHSFDPIAGTITLEAGPFPGRTVYVTYAGAPTEITFGDTFTECGLAETAKLTIKYAVCSNLVAYLDSAQLPLDTAEADEYDATRGSVGNATRISTQLYQRYLVELENERKRQNETTKPTISVRTR